MCLYTEQLKPLIAEEDIRVLKALHRIYSDDENECKLMSPFRYFEYKIGVEYTSTLKLDCEAFRSLATVEEGLHSFVYDESIITQYHNPLHQWDSGTVAEAIIPKGSEYYVGTWMKDIKSIASNKLRIVKVLD